MKIELELGKMLDLEVEINGFNDKTTGKQIIFKPENGTYEIEDALFKEWIMDEA